MVLLMLKRKKEVHFCFPISSALSVSDAIGYLHSLHSKILEFFAINFESMILNSVISRKHSIILFQILVPNYI